MITTLDLETTFTKDGDPSPFNAENKMVSVGFYNFHLFNFDNLVGLQPLRLPGILGVWV